MRPLDQIDLLFDSALGRFFAIPARQPAVGSITFAQMKVLLALKRMEVPTLSGVARRLNVRCSTAAELLDRLVAQGHVTRLRSSADRREVSLALTGHGRALMAGFVRKRRSRFAKLLGVLEPGDVGRLVGALDTLNEILGKWNGV